MRILLTTDTVGGVWTFSRELTLGLLERGHCVAQVSLGRAPSDSQWAWVFEVRKRYERAFRYDASDAPLEWMERNQHAYSDAEDLLLRVMYEFEAEVVHASQFCFGALPVALPKMVTAHSDVLSWAEACRPNGLEESDWLRRYRAFVASGLRGANIVVTPSCWMRDALVRHYPSFPAARVILNGRSLAQAEGSRTRRLQAVTVGRAWDEGKGLSALNGVNACMPVLALGETQFEGGQAPAFEAIRFLGRMAEDEVLELFRSSSLYLATSIYEPFGLAPLEAALCGCGVLARDIASLREVWGDAADYFTSGDELGELMFRLKSSPQELAALQRRSKHRAFELSADRMVGGYLEQYEALLPNTKGHEEVAAYAT